MILLHVCKDDAHKVVLFACSIFFKIRRGELVEVIQVGVRSGRFWRAGRSDSARVVRSGSYWRALVINQPNTQY